MNDVDDFLAHYGIPGMKWGKRKAEDSSGGSRSSKAEEKTAKRETKAQKFDEKASGLNTKIKKLDDEIAALPNSGKGAYDRSILNEVRNDLSKTRDTALKDAQAVRDGKMTSTQKKVVIGASIVAGLAATYVIQDQIQSGNATRMIAKGKEKITGEKFAFKKNDYLANKDFDVNDIHSQVVKKINPDYGAIGTKMNCRRATFSYEMRRRGYDVKATRTTNANGQNVIGLHNATTPGSKMSTNNFNVVSKLTKQNMAKQKGSNVDTPLADLAANFGAGGKNKIPPHGKGYADGIFESLSKQPNGSRGELGVMWNMGGGHSMAYEIVKGKPVIFDGQTGKKFEAAEEFFKSMPSVKQAGFTRLDNVDLNVDYLMRWMTNA
jgi:hypothetical protein